MASRVAEVVDELCAAQNERDAALTFRLREVELQRDAAVDGRRRGRGGALSRRRRHSRTKRRWDEENGDEPRFPEDERRLLPFYSLRPEDDDDDDDDGFDEFSLQAKTLTLQFRQRVEEVEAEKQRVKRIVEAEIQAAVEERDLVLGKCRIMREEMEKMKKKTQAQVTPVKKLPSLTMLN